MRFRLLLLFLMISFRGYASLAPELPAQNPPSQGVSQSSSLPQSPPLPTHQLLQAPNPLPQGAQLLQLIRHNEERNFWTSVCNNDDDRRIGTAVCIALHCAGRFLSCFI